MPRTPNAENRGVFRLEKKEPPLPASGDLLELLTLCAQVRALNDGEWYSIAAFEKDNAARSRTTSLKKRAEVKDFEIRCGVSATDDGKKVTEIFVKAPKAAAERPTPPRVETDREAQRRQAAADAAMPA